MPIEDLYGICPIEDLTGICPDCRKKVTYRQKSVECKNCLNWFNQKQGKLQETEYSNRANAVSFCSACCELGERNRIKTLSETSR